MKIQPHSNANYIVITDPTPVALAEAKILEKGNWAKVQPSGAIVVHKQFSPKFEAMIERESHKDMNVPIFSSHEEMMKWLDKNVSTLAFNYFEHMRTNEFNARFGGKNVAEADDYGRFCAGD